MHEHDVEKDRLSQLLGQEVLHLESLTGGLSNRCLLLTLANGKAVWRPVSKASSAFAVSRDNEQQVLQVLDTVQEKESRQFRAPKVLWQGKEGLLVEWLDGEVLDEQFSLHHLMALQAEIHTQPTPNHQLDVHLKAEQYWQAIALQDKSPALQAVFARFQRQPLPIHFPLACCHLDLGTYNLIRQSDGCIGVLDWEYAAAADPALDVAMTIHANGYDLQIAVEAYCDAKQADTQLWLAAVKAWLPWCDYLAMLWYFAGASAWQDESYRQSGLALLSKLTAV
ncbi:hypothetical protein A3K86_05010 [Photobacterium jeanii]|uniref:Aminoglycoside phosphotransferase domain-containing protein n=1 Tax=Photobacterium jeanii TaxID=858640 RepID=A0A178KLV9_9GAMM|nr:phosphotransferase [Photobacterium jeanii]OAN18257.1 hypothetical protein A3K86_05010 [Photobacterium jeanii]PST92065.1 thiamine kinase [Photobacterium jeanii]